MKKFRNHSLALNTSYARRKNRTNTTIKSISSLPRLIVNRTNCHIYAQVVQDGKVLAYAHDLTTFTGTKVSSAHWVWESIWLALQKAWVASVAFDRNWFIYHGRVKSLAEWVRSTWIIL